MSYIQSVYDRLHDHVIERYMQDWEVDFDRERMFLEVHFPLNGWKVVCWEIVFGECSFYIAPCSTDSNYLAADIIAIGELVNAMNNIAHKDFMEALSESESLDGVVWPKEGVDLDGVFDKASDQFLEFLDGRGGQNE